MAFGFENQAVGEAYSQGLRQTSFDEDLGLSICNGESTFVFDNVLHCASHSGRCSHIRPQIFFLEIRISCWKLEVVYV